MVPPRGVSGLLILQDDYLLSSDTKIIILFNTAKYYTNYLSIYIHVYLYLCFYLYIYFLSLDLQRNTKYSLKTYRNLCGSK